MGVKGSCRSANRGGVPFCMLSIYKAGFYSPLLPESSITPQGQKGIESGQKGSKVNIYLLDFVSPREFRRQQTAKFKIYLNFEGAGASVVALSLGRWWCPLVAGGALLLPLFGCVPSLSPCLCPLSRFPFLLCLSNMPLFGVLGAFLAGFGVRMYVCMGLGFCVDCGAFVCVRG